MANKRNIVKFEVLDHGYQHSQYFQGCGTSFTDYNHVVTGSGTTQKESYEDALNQIYGALHVGDLDLSRLERHGNANYFRTRIPADISKAFRENDTCETSYLISIRFNLPAFLETENQKAIEAFRTKINPA